MSVSLGEGITLIPNTNLRAGRTGDATISPFGARLSLDADSVPVFPLTPPPPITRFRVGSFSRSFSASFSGGNVRAP